jgi:hypothetical protein
MEFVTITVCISFHEKEDLRTKMKQDKTTHSELQSTRHNNKDCAER